MAESDARETEFLDRPSIPNYEIEERLGEGGMGSVWLACDSRLGRKVVLKVPRAEFTRDEYRLQLFLREARAASALNHPNIITIYEAGEAGGLRFVAMEFIEGQTVRQLIAHGPMSPREAIRITRQIAVALEAAHRVGIIHRDIKPENIMVRPDGLVKVLDFGVAHFEPQPGAEIPKPFKTRLGMLVGTPGYMSPEQARGKTVDQRSDIFSVGTVFYEMLAGKELFPGNTEAEVFGALLERDPPPLSDPALDAVIRRALAKNPNDRYQSMGEFAAALEAAQGWVSTAAGTLSTGTAQKTKSRYWPTPPWGSRLGLTVAALAAAVGLYLLVSRGNGSADSTPPETLPFTTFPGTKAFSSFSPDGSQIAFSWDGGDPSVSGNRSIYVKLVGLGEPVRLTHPNKDQDDSAPAWSPDGRYIAFQRGRSIMLVPALPGGTEQKIAEGSNGGVSWSPDGNTLAVTSLPKPGEPTAIFLLTLATGERRRLTNPSPPAADHSPVFSPNGSSVAFMRNLTSSGREIFVVPAAGGNARQVTTDRRPIIGVTWTADSRELVFSSVRTGGRGLWRIPVSGGTPRHVETPARNPTYPAISRQGTRLAYTDSFTDTNLYLKTSAGFDKNGLPASFAGEPRQILSSTRDDHSPRISPDGNRVAFVSNRTGAEEIWISNIDGSAMTQLTHIDGAPTGTPAWSPDGRWIAFDTRTAGSPDIYVIGVDSGALVRFTTADTSETTPCFSRDGAWLYFNSDRNGGKSNIWRQRIQDGHPEGDATQVTQGGAFEGWETPDGKSFVYSRGSGTYGLWSVPVGGGEEKPFHEKAGYWRSWGILPQGLYYIAKENTPFQTVRFLNFASGKETALTTIPKEPIWFQPGLSISTDGRQLIYVQTDHQVTDLILVEHFR